MSHMDNQNFFRDTCISVKEIPLDSKKILDIIFHDGAQIDFPIFKLNIIEYKNFRH